MSAYPYGVSVVIGAYRDGEALIKTVDSVLAQLEEPQNHALNLEIIIVNDGGDESITLALKQLRELNPDIVKLNIIQQENSGLTKALIKGCAQAQYEFISRIDVGDLMLKGRLATQLQKLSSKSGHEDELKTVAVGTWADIVTKETYSLYQVAHSDEQVQKFLQSPNLEDGSWDEFTSPQHYTMLLRRSAYEQVGGYRSEFYYAQDVDLWLRLSEVGQVRVIEKVLTQAIFSAGSISGANNRAQDELSRIACRGAILRRSTKDKASEEALLEQARKIRPDNRLSLVQHEFQKKTQKQTTLVSSENNASFKSVYFIAKCLLDKKHYGARQYFRHAIAYQPLAAKAWLGWVRSLAIGKPSE